MTNKGKIIDSNELNEILGANDFNAFKDFIDSLESLDLYTSNGNTLLNHIIIK